MFSTLLVIPPNYSYTYDYPPLGTPMLCGFLKSRGLAVGQLDLNLAYNKYLEQKIPNIIDYFEDKRTQKKYYSQNLPCYDDDLPYRDNSNSSFYFVERMLSSERLLRYIRDGGENTFRQFYNQNDIQAMLFRQRPGLLGISIISPAQVIGAFTLADILKEKNPSLPIVIGGQWPTLFREELMKRNDFGVWYDYLIFFEGETPLYELTRVLQGEKSLAQVPNLIYKREGRFVKSNSSSVEDLNSLSCPDFDGLDLRAYKYPSTIPYQSSRECYWNKCVFCVDLPHPKQGYRARKPELVVSDLKALQAKYNIQTIMFSDPALSPRQMRGISEGILENDLLINWWAMARFEPAFSYELLKLALRAGCFELDFGFETASARLLEFLKKGTRREIFQRIIRDCYKAGISVSLQTVLGFPSETMDEAMETIAFLVEEKDYIRGAVFNTYYLTPGNEIFETPQKYGIHFERDEKIPFKFFYDYTHISGEVSSGAASNFRKMYAELIHRDRKECPQKVVTVEDHDEAYYHWKKLKIKEKTIVHCDAHLDFNWPPDAKVMDISNYLYFALKENMVGELFWVAPTPIWQDQEERNYLKRWLLQKIFVNTPIQEDAHSLSASLLNKKVVITDMEHLPVFDKGIILDIDTDFFVTSSMEEADFPHRYNRRAWLLTDQFVHWVKEKFPAIEGAVIAYSVRYGYTPIEAKGLGDELLTKLLLVVK